MSLKSVIIIPTYNEKDNIGRLIDYLKNQVFPQIDKKFDMHILVVDDSSPDGTSQVVQKLQKKYNNLHLLINPQKSGLGGAYLKGMIKAIDEFNADILFEMDADFSHDPKLIPQFLKKIDQGNDLVLGSRYIKGGSIPKDWGLHRKLLSLLGNTIIRIIITYFSIHDWTTGYRAIRKKVFQKIRKEMKKSEFSGYTWQIGFLHKTIRNNFKVSEVPLKFIDRKYGKSKLGMEYIKNTLFYIIKIRLKELQKIIKFGIVGTIGFIINTLAYSLFKNTLKMDWRLANIIAVELSIISNFNLNNLWTFRENKITQTKKLLSKFIQFNLTSAAAFFIQIAGGYLGRAIAGERYDLLYLIISILIGLFFNFFVYTKIIWKDKK